VRTCELLPGGQQGGNSCQWMTPTNFRTECSHRCCDSCRWLITHWGRTRVACWCAVRQAGVSLWREIHEFPPLRYAFEVSESDELTSSGNPAEQAQSDISRDRRQCYEIPEAGAGSLPATAEAECR
jgi:hypothetical protein